MNSKQRVHAALRRQPTDRVPIFMAFHNETLASLARVLDIPRHCVDLALGNDVRMAWVANDYSIEGMPHDKEGEGHVDLWGIRWVKQGLFNRVAEHPLAERSPDEVRRYCFPLQHVEEFLSRVIRSWAAPTSTSSAATCRRACLTCTRAPRARAGPGGLAGGAGPGR